MPKISFTVHAKYMVDADRGKRREFNSLPEAKVYAILLAKKNAGKGRYNVSVRYSHVYADAGVGGTHWVELYSVPYPVRGTGTSMERIVEGMRKRGTPPFVPIRNQNFKRAVIRIRMGYREFDEKYGGIHGDRFDADFGKKRITTRRLK